MVGTTGFEPATSSVSRKRSNQLSYAPVLRQWIVYQECVDRKRKLPLPLRRPHPLLWAGEDEHPDPSMAQHDAKQRGHNANLSPCASTVIRTAAARPNEYKSFVGGLDDPGASVQFDDSGRISRTGSAQQEARGRWQCRALALRASFRAQIARRARQVLSYLQILRPLPSP